MLKTCVTWPTFTPIPFLVWTGTHTFSTSFLPCNIYHTPTLLLFATLPPEWREFHTIRSSSNLKWTEVFCQPVAGSWRKSLAAAIKPERELGLRVKWPRGEWGGTWSIWYKIRRISNMWPKNTVFFFHFSRIINAISLFSFSGSWSEDLIYCFALDRQTETVLQTSVCWP